MENPSIFIDALSACAPGVVASAVYYGLLIAGFAFAAGYGLKKILFQRETEHLKLQASDAEKENASLRQQIAEEKAKPKAAPAKYLQCLVCGHFHLRFLEKVRVRKVEGGYGTTMSVPLAAPLYRFECEKCKEVREVFEPILETLLRAEKTTTKLL